MVKFWKSNLVQSPSVSFIWCTYGLNYSWENTTDGLRLFSSNAFVLDWCDILEIFSTTKTVSFGPYYQLPMKIKLPFLNCGSKLFSTVVRRQKDGCWLEFERRWWDGRRHGKSVQKWHRWQFQKNGDGGGGGDYGCGDHVVAIWSEYCDTGVGPA